MTPHPGTPSHPEDDALLDRVRARVMREVAAQAQSVLHTTVRAGDRPWEPVAPGVERRVLFETDTTLSSLLRLAAGTTVPGHAHPIHEECLVLEGTLKIGQDLLLHPGDFHVGLQGVPHADASTDTGAVVFLREGKPQAA
jgi:quercetin dioxygenase-like cupin family protein